MCGLGVWGGIGLILGLGTTAEKIPHARRRGLGAVATRQPHRRRLIRVDKDKNGVVGPAEQLLRQVLRNAADLRSDKTKLMRFVLVLAFCLFLDIVGRERWHGVCGF